MSDAETRDQQLSEEAAETRDVPEEIGSDSSPTEEAPESELADRLLRAQAELDNYRKRAARELEAERRYAAMPLLRELLPVMDNIYRAIEAGEKNDAPPGLREGFRMVATQMEEVLGRHHCKLIDAHRQPFDPNVHEAVARIPSLEHPENTVVEVTSTGYQLHDRVVRPAQVVVSAGPPAETSQDKQEEAAQAER